MGSTIGFLTILVAKLQTEENAALKMSLEDASWIGTIWAFTSMSSSLVGGFLADAIGRKRAIIVSSLPFIVSWILLATATSSTSILLGIGFAGLGDGLMFPIIPIYVTEIAHPNLRATLSNLVNCTQILGLILDFSLIMVIQWRTIAGIMVIPPIATMVTMMMAPETPHWLANKGRNEEARKSLSWLRNGADSTEEMKEIFSNANSNQEAQSLWQKAKAKINIYRSREFLKPFSFAGTLFCLYNFSGFTLIQVYMMTIFNETDSSIDSSMATLFVSVWRLFVSLVASFALHHVSRRTLFLSTTLLVAASQASLGFFFYLKTLPEWQYFTTNFSWFPLICIISIYGGGQLGFNPVLKIVMSEVFPTSIRATSVSLCIVAGFLCVGVANKLFSQFVFLFGFYGSFWIYSAVTILCWLFGYFGMPETAGVSLVKIQEKLANKGCVDDCS